MKLYLYEGLNAQDRASVMLWESAGRKLVEAQLTADQITQLFQQIQTAKGNRTLVGQTKDAGSAVMQAYNDLKSKVANSGPIKNMDALYDQAAEKLKQATGGDQGAMSYVQKYRDFAKKHPIAQSLIYGALIAAAGISGAGAGGAAALGLFKMVDKLLQGEKFSSAAYSGAKTGALAYGASKLGDYMKGDQAQQAAGALDPDAQNIADQAKELVKDYDPTKYNYVPDGTEINIIDKATGQLAGTYPVDMATADEVIAQVTNVGKVASGAVDAAATSAQVAGQTFESRDLTRKQVLALFERVTRLNSRMLNEGRLQEGIWDDIKSGAKKAVGAVAQGAAKIGRSMTAKVSSDALTKAWQAAGSPTDSVAIEKLLQAQGVNPEVIKTVFQANNIPVSVTTGSVGTDPNQPMPNVMSTNRTTSTTTPQTQATQTQPQAALTAKATTNRLPDVSKLTPKQKTALITKIDQRLAMLTSPAASPASPGLAIAQPTLNPTMPQKISAPANPGAPTPAEQAKLQQKIQAATAQQP